MQQTETKETETETSLQDSSKLWKCHTIWLQNENKYTAGISLFPL